MINAAYKLMSSLTVIALFATTSCSDKAEDEDADNTRIAWPSKDLEDDGDGLMMNFNTPDVVSGAGTWKNKYWINFDGATIKKSRSFIVEQAKLDKVVIPEFVAADMGDLGESLTRDAVIKLLMDDLESLYNGIDIVFSTKKPEAPYSTLHVGGSDFRPNKDVLGVAPLDVDNFGGNDILFAFPKGLDSSRGASNIKILAHTMAHEISHSLGAQHIKNEFAIMNPFVDVATDAFGTGTISNSGGKQDTPILLGRNAGLVAKTNIEKSLPELKGLNIVSQGNIAQYSIFSLKNFEGNPKHNLTDFVYTWKFDSYTTEGPTIRVRYEDEDVHDCVVTVRNPRTGESKDFPFDVGMIQ